jgi:hypothetical protein
MMNAVFLFRTASQVFAALVLCIWSDLSIMIAPTTCKVLSLLPNIATMCVLTELCSSRGHGPVRLSGTESIGPHDSFGHSRIYIFSEIEYEKAD